jgi:hypothetical protein
MDGGDEFITLVNEYSGVRVGIDRSFAGPRLTLRSDRTGDEITLDATALEAIASMDQGAIGTLVAVFSETGNAGDAVAAP